MKDMMIIEIYLNGDLYVMDAAPSNHEAGKIINRCENFMMEMGHKLSDIEVYVDDVKRERPEFVIDVKRVAKNMKSRYIEDRIMGDMDI